MWCSNITCQICSSVYQKSERGRFWFHSLDRVSIENFSQLFPLLSVWLAGLLSSICFNIILVRGERRGGVHTADLTFIVVLPRNLIISKQIIIKHFWFGANTQRTQLIRVQYSPICTLPDCQREIKSPLDDLYLVILLRFYGF